VGESDGGCGWRTFGGLVNSRDEDGADLAVCAVEVEQRAQVALARHVAVHHDERLAIVEVLLRESERTGCAERLSLLRQGDLDAVVAVRLEELGHNLGPVVDREHYLRHPRILEELHLVLELRLPTEFDERLRLREGERPELSAESAHQDEALHASGVRCGDAPARRAVAWSERRKKPDATMKALSPGSCRAQLHARECMPDLRSRRSSRSRADLDEDKKRNLSFARWPPQPNSHRSWGRRRRALTRVRRRRRSA